MHVDIKQSTIRGCVLFSLALGVATANATPVTEAAQPPAPGPRTIDTTEPRHVAALGTAAASASAPAASASSASEFTPTRIPEELLGAGPVGPASTRDQTPRLDEKNAPWAQNDPRTAPSADGTVWVNGEPEVTWMRSMLNHLRDDGLTALIVILTVVGLAWLLYAIWSYMRMSLTRADEVRPRRKRHRHSQSRSSERSDGSSSTREHRRRRRSHPSS